MRANHLSCLLALSAGLLLTGAVPALSRDMLENMAYHTGLADEDVLLKLVKGQYDYAPGEGYVKIERIVMGDLDGDGARDAAVELVENGGGTGYFRSLQIVRNHQGRPQLLPIYLPLGDRSIIRQLSIQAGLIRLRMIVTGPDDGACCPTKPLSQTFRLKGTQLIELPAGR